MLPCFSWELKSCVYLNPWFLRDKGEAFEAQRQGRVVSIVFCAGFHIYCTEVALLVERALKTVLNS